MAVVAATAAPAPVPVTSAQIQAAFDRGISHAAVEILSEELMHIMPGSAAFEDKNNHELYFLLKKAIDTILQKKERDPGNKRFNNAHNRMSDNVEDLVRQVQQSVDKLNNTNLKDRIRPDLRDRVRQSLDNARIILKLRGNEAEVKKEFNETLLRIQAAEEAVRDAPAKAKEAAAASAAALWDATHKRMEAAKERIAMRFPPPGTNVGGSKRTRRNRKNKKSRKYTRRN